MQIMQVNEAITELVEELLVQKKFAEQAMTQVKGELLRQALDPQSVDSNSILVLMKHVAWGIHFRLRKVLGDQVPELMDRDDSLALNDVDSLDSVSTLWNVAWAHVKNLGQVTELEGTVDIRGKQVAKYQVLLGLAHHVSAHLGQIILLSKHFAGEDWKAVTVPKKLAHA